MQVCVLDTELFIRTCEPTSNRFKLRYELSADQVQEAIREVKKYKFDEVSTVLGRMIPCIVLIWPELGD